MQTSTNSNTNEHYLRSDVTHFRPLPDIHVVDEHGDRHVLRAEVKMIDVTIYGIPRERVDGLIHLRTMDGFDVSRRKDGTYVVGKTGQVLRDARTGLSNAARSR